MASSAVHQHIILIMVGEVKQIPVQAGRLNDSLYVKRKTSSGQWASGKTKSSTSTPFHMRSQILALLHRVNSLFVCNRSWNGSERMCLTRRSDSCLIKNSTEHWLGWCPSGCPASWANQLLSKLSPSPRGCPPYLLTSSAQTGTLPVNVLDKSMFSSGNLLSWKTPHYLYLYTHNRLPGLCCWRRSWKWVIVLTWDVNEENWTCWPCLAQGKGRTLQGIQL